MNIETRQHGYSDGDTALQATVAWDRDVDGMRPGVLVSHAWRGRSGFEDGKAIELAKLGYVGFALDLYGKGVIGRSPDENRELMQPFVDDRPMLQRRMQLALSELRGIDTVDSTCVAAMGFCFGGLCVLDLARTGIDIDGVASFHGLLGAPGNTGDHRVTARILALHGWDDPMVPPEHVVAFAREMSELGADWQLHAYGNTLHAFTNPEADDAAHGLRYDPLADRRSWQTLQHFLRELFD